MMKRGYTLIELIAVMSILAILLGSGFTIVSIVSALKIEVEFEDDIGEISSILSYGKAYCRKNNTSGEIIIDTAGKKVSFRDTKKIIKTADLSEIVRVTFNGTSSSIININEEGYLKKACNIEVKNGKKRKVITIAVGADKVTVKPGQEIVSDIEESK